MRETPTPPTPVTLPPGFREPHDYAGYLLQLAARLREDALEAHLAPLGLTVARGHILGVIRRLKACTMGELAFFTTIDRTTLTRIIDQFFAQGLVERHTPAGDRRKVTLSLTAKGRGLHQRGIAAIADINRQVFEGAPEGALDHALRQLQATIAAAVPDAKQREMLLTFSRGTEASD
ncbi:MAG TPA: MarR family winged helix-turn-helix transcriptional regulator [Caulobacteraceae bacterium]|jgi:DNA-binding MarR family transcriptional regulator